MEILLLVLSLSLVVVGFLAVASSGAGDTADDTADDTPSKREEVRSELRMIAWRDLHVKEDDWAFREKAELSDKSLTALSDNIAAVGLLVPLMARTDGDKFHVIDGHRRYFAIHRLVREGIKGYSEDSKFPVNVLIDLSDKEALARAAEANAHREPPKGLQRIRLAVKLRVFGWGEADVQKILKISESTLTRDLVVGNSPWAMTHCENGNATETRMASLLSLATAKKRLDEFQQAFDAWVIKELEKIETEQIRRAGADEKPLSEEKQKPRAYLDNKVVGHWQRALENGESLEGSSFRYAASIKDDKGRKKIEVDSLNEYIADLDSTKLSKVYSRLKTMLRDLKPVLQEVQQREFKDDDEVAYDPAAIQDLRDLGLNSEADELEAEQKKRKASKGKPTKAPTTAPKAEPKDMASTIKLVTGDDQEDQGQEEAKDGEGQEEASDKEGDE